MIKSLMVSLFVALIAVASTAVVYRGWQVTHPSDTSLDLSKHSASEIAASVVVWVSQRPEKDIPVLTKVISTNITATLGPIRNVFNAEAVTSVVQWTDHQVVALGAWTRGQVQALKVLAGGNSEKAVPSPTPVPVPTPAPAPPAPVVNAPVVNAPVVSAPIVTEPVAPPKVVAAPPSSPSLPQAVKAEPPLPTPVPVPVPVPVQAQVATTLPKAASPPTASVESKVIVESSPAWTPAQKGCLLGGASSGTAALLIGPAELAAWATGSAFVPATLRLTGTVLGIALVSGCVTGAIVAPSFAR